MLTGIQITFMIFCWVVIFGCICSVIYSVVDLMRARHEERKKAKRDEEDRKYRQWLQQNFPLTATRYITQAELDKMAEDMRKTQMSLEMAKKERSQQGDDNIHTDS